MNMKTLFILTTSLIMCAPVFAQTDATQTAATAPQPGKPVPYGDNPNIFKVLAHKAQQTAEKVGESTEQGIRRIKPDIDQAWQSTKTYNSEQAKIARENTQKGKQAATRKWQETKENLVGQPDSSPTPVEQHPLSQPATHE